MPHNNGHNPAQHLAVSRSRADNTGATNHALDLNHLDQRIIQDLKQSLKRDITYIYQLNRQLGRTGKFPRLSLQERLLIDRIVNRIEQELLYYGKET